MSQEATLAATLAFAKGSISTKSLQLASSKFDVAGNDFVQASQTIPTTAGGTAINLGNLSGALGLWAIKNNDPTNYVDLMSGVSGTAFDRIMPGEMHVGRFPASITAPAALAHTGAVSIEYLILEA